MAKLTAHQRVLLKAIHKALRADNTCNWEEVWDRYPETSRINMTLIMKNFDRAGDRLVALGLVGQRDDGRLFMTGSGYAELGIRFDNVEVTHGTQG